jgi:hypothetical protein
MRGKTRPNEEMKTFERSADQENLPATSLIVCSRNRPELLWDTIQSILQGYEIPPK